MYTIKYLMENSGLPGPRGNLTLLYEFARNTEEDLIELCLEYITPEVKNSPEEFVGMCGILAYSIKNKTYPEKVFPFLKIYANHPSWRIREAVAISIQEIFETGTSALIEGVKDFINGNALEQRAVVAGLCEPKLLKTPEFISSVLNILLEITEPFAHDGKLDESSTSLRKALGYGWSVVIAASPDEGRVVFEKLFDLPGKHVSWIIKENLKKNRVKRIDEQWVNDSLLRIK